MRIKLGATIPTVQYGNIQPEFESDNADDLPLLEAQIQALWNKYGDKPLNISGGDKQLIKAFVGGEIYYDENSHSYTNKEGDIYLSGSQYAKSFEKPFDRNQISGVMAKKFDVKAQDIVDMWELKSNISTGFGTAIHAALELYERFKGLSEAMEKETHLHDHPIIKSAVEGFYELQDASLKAEVEAVVVDHAAKRAGRVDRIVITGEKKCRIQDIKTNADIKKYLPQYWKQLELYKEVMEANGWTVEALDIFHWNGAWKKYES